MMWSICLIIALVFMAFSVFFAIWKARSKYKTGRWLDPSKILFIGVILSSTVLFLPIYVKTFESGECGLFETILISIHNMIRLFIVDGEFSFITSSLDGVSPLVFKGYTIVFAILFVAAPLLTFGFVLSFFKNVSAYKRYIMSFKKNVFVFSELNEKSLALAQSLSQKKNEKRIFVFTDVFETEEEKNYELVEKAKELGAILFKKDILTVDFSFHSKTSELNFFVIGEDQSENITHSLKIAKLFSNRENTNLYVFSTQVESEMLLSNAFCLDNGNAKIKVRRVNEVRSLILRNLYENGYEKIFKSAYDDGSGVKQINAVVVGMGQHGTEMTKALSWYCQMDGYAVTINSFDLDKKADEKFDSLCPELMEYNGQQEHEDDAHYTIKVHSDIDVTTSTFDRIVYNLPQTTYVFVCLGKDETNVSTAVKLRSMFERIGHKPEIQAIVYNSDKKEALTGIVNAANTPYNIDFIGDMKSSYSEEVILASEVELLALERHKNWDSESSFWQYDYNYKSSIASAIHKKAKRECGIPGIEKVPAERTPEELWSIRILEHSRWNAYMRSEGYVYAGSIEKKDRNDLAKMHNNLVPFHELPPRTQEKDDD